MYLSLWQHWVHVENLDQYCTLFGSTKAYPKIGLEL